MEYRIQNINNFNSRKKAHHSYNNNTLINTNEQTTNLTKSSIKDSINNTILEKPFNNINNTNITNNNMSNDRKNVYNRRYSEGLQTYSYSNFITNNNSKGRMSIIKNEECKIHHVKTTSNDNDNYVDFDFEENIKNMEKMFDDKLALHEKDIYNDSSSKKINSFKANDNNNNNEIFYCNTESKKSLPNNTSFDRIPNNLINKTSSQKTAKFNTKNEVDNVVYSNNNNNYNNINANDLCSSNKALKQNLNNLELNFNNHLNTSTNTINNTITNTITDSKESKEDKISKKSKLSSGSNFSNQISSLLTKHKRNLSTNITKENKEEAIKNTSLSHNKQNKNNYINKNNNKLDKEALDGKIDSNFQFSLTQLVMENNYDEHYKEASDSNLNDKNNNGNCSSIPLVLQKAFSPSNNFHDLIEYQHINTLNGNFSTDNQYNKTKNIGSKSNINNAFGIKPTSDSSFDPNNIKPIKINDTESKEQNNTANEVDAGISNTTVECYDSYSNYLQSSNNDGNMIQSLKYNNNSKNKDSKVVDRYDNNISNYNNSIINNDVNHFISIKENDDITDKEADKKIIYNSTLNSINLNSNISLNNTISISSNTNRNNTYSNNINTDTNNNDKNQSIFLTNKNLTEVSFREEETPNKNNNNNNRANTNNPFFSRLRNTTYTENFKLDINIEEKISNQNVKKIIHYKELIKEYIELLPNEYSEAAKTLFDIITTSIDHLIIYFNLNVKLLDETKLKLSEEIKKNDNYFIKIEELTRIMIQLNKDKEELYREIKEISNKNEVLTKKYERVETKLKLVNEENNSIMNEMNEKDSYNKEKSKKHINDANITNTNIDDNDMDMNKKKSIISSTIIDSHLSSNNDNNLKNIHNKLIDYNIPFNISSSKSNIELFNRKRPKSNNLKYVNLNNTSLLSNIITNENSKSKTIITTFKKKRCKSNSQLCLSTLTNNEREVLNSLTRVNLTSKFSKINKYGNNNNNNNSCLSNYNNNSSITNTNTEKTSKEKNKNDSAKKTRNIANIINATNSPYTNAMNNNCSILHNNCNKTFNDINTINITQKKIISNNKNSKLRQQDNSNIDNISLNQINSNKKINNKSSNNISNNFNMSKNNKRNSLNYNNINNTELKKLFATMNMKIDLSNLISFNSNLIKDYNSTAKLSNNELISSKRKKVIRNNIINSTSNADNMKNNNNFNKNTSTNNTCNINTEICSDIDNKSQVSRITIDFINNKIKNLKRKTSQNKNSQSRNEIIKNKINLNNYASIIKGNVSSKSNNKKIIENNDNRDNNEYYYDDKNTNINNKNNYYNDNDNNIPDCNIKDQEINIDFSSLKPTNDSNSNNYNNSFSYTVIKPLNNKENSNNTNNSNSNYTKNKDKISKYNKYFNSLLEKQEEKAIFNLKNHRKTKIQLSKSKSKGKRNISFNFESMIEKLNTPNLLSSLSTSFSKKNKESKFSSSSFLNKNYFVYNNLCNNNLKLSKEKNKLNSNNNHSVNYISSGRNNNINTKNK